MKRLALFLGLVLALSLLSGMQTQKAKAQVAEEGFSIFSVCIRAIYVICGQFIPVISLVINTLSVLFSSFFYTAPEFTTGFLAGFFFAVLATYAITFIWPGTLINLIILLFTGIPIFVFIDPVFYLCLIISIPLGIILGLFLGVANLVRRPTPLEYVNRSGG